MASPCYSPTSTLLSTFWGHPCQMCGHPVGGAACDCGPHGRRGCVKMGDQGQEQQLKTGTKEKAGELQACGVSSFWVFILL